MDYITTIKCCSCVKRYDPKCMFCRGTNAVRMEKGKTLCPACKGVFKDGEFCTHCNGWGYVQTGSPDAKCLHEWTLVERIGGCRTRYKCKLCDHTREIDSSG